MDDVPGRRNARHSITAPLQLEHLALGIHAAHTGLIYIFDNDTFRTTAPNKR